MKTISLLLLLLPAAAAAQAPAASDQADPLLTPDEAVRIGLEHNHALSLVRDDAAIARNNRKAGIGPFLPDLSASAGHSGTIGEGRNTTRVGASTGLILFDGFASWHSYQRLKTLEASARLDERLQIESTLESVLSGYFGIVQQERRLEAIRELLAVSEERARLAQARMEVGAGSRLEQLQALSDLNADSAAFLSQTVAIREAKMDLNFLLGRDPLTGFRVQDTIPLDAGLPVGAWRERLAEANAAILRARERRKASSYALKEARSGYYPDLNASLSYGNSVEDLGRDPNLTYGINLSVPLFDRLRTRRDVGNARLSLRQEETRLRQQEQQIRSDFEQAVERHASALRRVALEERNLEVSRLQAEAARERYRLGASSPLEFRDAQTRLLDSHSRLAAARQETKTAELALKRLAGALVREAPAGEPAAAPAGGEP